MKYVSPDVVKRLQKIDLLTYLRNYEPQELVHISGDNYCTRSHDSLKISNGLWNWFSKGIGGKNAIDYLMKVRGYSFMESVQILLEKENISVSISESSYKGKQKKYNLVLPKKSNDFSVAREYLINRGIDENIIDNCYKNNLIYQEKDTNNVVFLGYDEQNNIKYCGIRATNDTRFMRDATGSDKAYSFRLLNKNNSNTVHIFESSIDLLSYATLCFYKGIDYKNENLISLSGVYQPAKNIEQSKVPLAIENYLVENKNIKNIVLHFDNDFAGRNATKALQILLSKDYGVFDIPVPVGKDVNDYLCYMLGLKVFKNIKKERVK